MNDKDLELVRDVINSVGSVGGRAFDSLAHYCFADGVTGVFGFLILIGLASYLLRRAFNWKPGQNEEAHVARAASIVILCVAITVFICGFFGSTASVIAPEGAAIRLIINHK